MRPRSEARMDEAPCAGYMRQDSRMVSIIAVQAMLASAGVLGVAPDDRRELGCVAGLDQVELPLQ